MVGRRKLHQSSTDSTQKINAPYNGKYNCNNANNNSHINLPHHLFINLNNSNNMRLFFIDCNVGIFLKIVCIFYKSDLFTLVS